MKPTKLQLLRNPDEKPTSENIKTGLKEAYTTYLRFLDELESHGIELEWNYYNDGKAWLGKVLHKWIGVRGGRREVTVFWLSIWEGFFKVSIFFPEKVREEVLKLPIENQVKKMIVDSKQMGEKSKYFPVVFEINDDEMLEDLFTLAVFRKSI